MSEKLNVGVLGCGPIAQAAHFESCTKARNAELYAVCDVADDLRERMAAAHGAQKQFKDYAAMLADPALDAVIIATSDAFHVAAAKQALDAGKHVLCEKPLGVSVEEVESLRGAVKASGKQLQVGHMKRFDAGLQSARDFVVGEMGEMLAHGCHLLDVARYFGGPITTIDTRLRQRFSAYCWFMDVEFASGALGHLDLTIAVRGDWHEGFQIYGERGSVMGKTYNPWFFKSSDVEIFHELTGSTTRVLGADGHFYRRQLEGFADAILNSTPLTGADVEDGIASVRGMVAAARSASSGKPVTLAEVSGAV